MQTADKRGEVVAGLGAILSLMAGVVLGLVAIWNGSTVIWAVAFQSLCAVGIWLLSLIQLHQQRLLGEERLELAALERERQERLGGAQTIFQEEELDQMDKLAMGRRLRAIERSTSSPVSPAPTIKTRTRSRRRSRDNKSRISTNDIRAAISSALTTSQSMSSTARGAPPSL